MNALMRKLSILENNVLDALPAEGTTRLTWNNGNEELDRAEDLLYENAKAIIERHQEDKEETGDSTLQLSPADKIITDAAHKRFMFRLLEMVRNFGDAFIYQDNKMGEIWFMTHFYWIIDQTQKAMENDKLETDVYNQPGFFELCEGEQQKQIDAMEQHRHKDIFSEASFHKYLEDSHFSKSTEQMHKAAIEYYANRTPEQIVADDLEEKEDQEREAADTALDAKYLAEKCPACAEKCGWYNKQQQNLDAPQQTQPNLQPTALTQITLK